MAPENVCRSLRGTISGRGTLKKGVFSLELFERETGSGVGSLLVADEAIETRAASFFAGLYREKRNTQRLQKTPMRTLHEYLLSTHNPQSIP